MIVFQSLPGTILTRCAAPEMDGALPLDRVLEDHVGARGLPAWRGAPIGHVERQLTVPIGAAAGTVSDEDVLADLLYRG